MTFVIRETCIGVQAEEGPICAKECVPVCPVECIYERGTQYYIEPAECIDCGACLPECPIPDAIIAPPEYAALAAEVAAQERRMAGQVDEVPPEEPAAEEVASEDEQGG